MAEKEQVAPAYPSAHNLYLFIRDVLGEQVSDNEIARRWGVDARVFNDIKHGRVAVPRLERLRDLSRVLGVNEHFVYAAGAGVPTKKLMSMVRRQDISAAVGVLVGATAKAEERAKQTEEALADKHKELERVASELELKDAQLQSLLEQLLVAVLTLDLQGNVVHVNQIGRELFGVTDVTPGVPLGVATEGTMFLDTDGRPIEVPRLPSYVALKTKKAAKAVFSVHRPGKKGRLVAATATPMRAGRKFIGVISVVRDIEDILSAVGGIGVDMPTHPKLIRATRRKKA